MTNNEAAASWTMDDLLDSDPLEEGHGPLRIVWTQLHTYLHDANKEVVQAFCVVLRRKPRTPAKLVALHLAHRASGPLAELVDELLVSDPLLYAHNRGSELVAEAIRARWPSLDPDERKAVIANIKYCDQASLSFAHTRSLIAAIPEADRDRELEALLTELGGPPAASSKPNGGTNEIGASPNRAEPRSRSVAEQVADVPTWLKASTIPWNRIAAALYDDERNRAAESPERLLSKETALACTNAALAAIEGFSESALSDSQQKEILQIADICLAHPSLESDDVLNDRLIAALRCGVFKAPVRRDSAVYALELIRPWHWRQTRGRELVVELLSTESDPAVVDAAISLLYRPDADAIVAGAKALVGSGRSANEKAAESLGRLMGNAALFLPSVAEELHQWLQTPPSTGLLSTPQALKEYIGGVAFGIKTGAHHPSIDPNVYAGWATELWTIWRTPRCVQVEGKGSLALYLMSPLHRNDETVSIAAKYWPALLPLFKTVLASGDSNEVYSALFDLDVDHLLPVALADLSLTLREAVRTELTSGGVGMDSQGRIAEVLLEIACHRLCPREVASKINQTLLTAGARKEALALERAWRDRS